MEFMKQEDVALKINIERIKLKFNNTEVKKKNLIEPLQAKVKETFQKSKLKETNIRLIYEESNNIR